MLGELLSKPYKGQSKQSVQLLTTANTLS